MLSTKQFFFSFLFVLVNTMPFCLQAQSSEFGVEAKIDLSNNGAFYEIAGLAINKSDVSEALSYKLLVNKIDQNNNSSKNTQEGQFVLNSGDRKILSKTSINATDDDKVIILLLIYDKNSNIVTKDRIVLNGTEEDEIIAQKALLERAVLNSKEVSQDIGNTSEDGVATLRGIVTESTKTKPGRDFFTSFSSKYRTQNINGEKPVLVEEVLALGINTKVLIKIDNNIVFEFLLNPRANYIEQMVDYAIFKTNTYFQQLKKNRNQIKRY